MDKEIQGVRRTSKKKNSLAGAVSRQMRAMNPETAVQFTPMTARGAGSISKPRFRIFFFNAEAGIRDTSVTGVQTCALPISSILGALLTAAFASAFAKAIAASPNG